jgi:hypothetical protein
MTGPLVRRSLRWGSMSGDEAFKGELVAFAQRAEALVWEKVARDHGNGVAPPSQELRDQPAPRPGADFLDDRRSHAGSLTFAQRLCYDVL